MLEVQVTQAVGQKRQLVEERKYPSAQLVQRVELMQDSHELEQGVQRPLAK